MLEERQVRRYRKMKLEAYYAGSFYGRSSAYLIYTLSQQLNKESCDQLWLWAIGLTYQYLHSRIAKLQYDDAIVELQRETVRLGRQKEAPGVVAEPTEEELKEVKVSSCNKEVGTIMIEQEYLNRDQIVGSVSCCCVTGHFMTARTTPITSQPGSAFGPYADAARWFRSRVSGTSASSLRKSGYRSRRPSSSTRT
jgi:hypothetical protein